MADKRTTILVTGRESLNKVKQQTILQEATRCGLLQKYENLKKDGGNFMVVLEFESHLMAYQAMNNLLEAGLEASWKEPRMNLNAPHPYDHAAQEIRTPAAAFTGSTPTEPYQLPSDYYVEKLNNLSVNETQKVYQKNIWEKPPTFSVSDRLKITTTTGAVPKRRENKTDQKQSNLTDRKIVFALVPYNSAPPGDAINLKKCRRSTPTYGDLWADREKTIHTQ